MDRRIHIGIIVLTVFAVFGLSNANGQNHWEKTFGGSAGDAARSVKQTTDGGFIIAGLTESFGAGGFDVYLIKTDGDGNELWSKTFGGSDHDYGYSAQQTADGGFIIAGWTSSFGAGESDVYLIKTDSDGNEIWSKTFGGIASEEVYSVQETADGGFIIAGLTYSFGAGESDAYLIKTDSDGNEIWSKTFGGNGNDAGFSVQQTTDGGFIIAGWKYNYLDIPRHYDVYLLKTDGDGNELWSKTFGGITAIGYSVQQTTDGGFIIAGYTFAFHGAGESDVYLIKTDGDGNELWSKTFGGTYQDVGRSAQQTTDGGFIIAGYTYSFGAGESDVYLIKTDGDGNELWSETFGGIGIDYERSVQQTTDGGFIIAGGTGSFGTGYRDVYLIYYKPNVSEIIGTWSNGIWSWNVAKSSWTKMTSYTTQKDVAAGDFTGDGKEDVASCWSSGLWYQDGATLGWTQIYHTAPDRIATGDITGDGVDEIIGCGGAWGSSGIWYRDVAKGTWYHPWSTSPSGPIAAGDVTGDGKADMVSCWPSGLWYQDGATLGWRKVYGTAPYKVTCGDVTGDGQAEIIGPWSNGIWYWDVAKSKWTKMTSYTTNGDIAAGDFTGDGKADVASCWGSSGLWYQDGATLGWTKVYNIAPYQLTAGDITGD